jgi:geranylgeranyl pyrophosphate synthase
LLRLEADVMDNEELGGKALEVLRFKSKEALESTKKAMLEEKMSKKVDAALRDYVKKWDDTTRPGVLSLACEAVNGNLNELIPLQTAMLLIAATMDIHDDIIDKSAAKATGKTIYGKTGGETALLLGNAFLVKGFIQLYKAIEKLPRERQLLIIDTTKAFLFEVIKAHIIEVELRNKKWDLKPKEYLQVLEEKAADIEGRMRIGAIFGGGTSSEIEALGKYGRCLGVLLAVRSDFVDIFEPRELENRVKSECLPLPVLYALENDNCRKRIMKVLSSEIISKDDAQELVDIIYQALRSSYLKRHLRRLLRKAIHLLDNIRASEAKIDLKVLAMSMLEDL